MKRILLTMLMVILFSTHCLAQTEESFAVIDWNDNKVVILDFSGNVLFEKDFDGIGCCYFIAPYLGGWLVKGCLECYGCTKDNWFIWELKPDGSISSTLTAVGPGPFYTGITSGNFLTGNVYTGVIDLYNENGSIIDSTNVWEEENGWPYDYSRLGDTAGLVSGGFVVPPQGGWPSIGALYTPYLYYYDNDLNLITKVDITSIDMRLFNLIGVSSGGFAGTCADHGTNDIVEYLCWFDPEGSLIEKVDVTGDLPFRQYMNVFIAGLSDGRVIVTVYGQDKVWIYDPPSSRRSFLASQPEELDLSGSGVSSIGGIAGNTFTIDSDSDEIPDVVDNCPNDANPDQEDTDGNGIGNVCDSNTTSSIYNSTTTTCIETTSSSTSTISISTTTVPYRDCAVQIDVSPPEGGTTSPSPGGFFSQGCSPITIRAIPNDGYNFSHWDGSVQSTSEAVTIRFEERDNEYVVAVFDKSKNSIDASSTVLIGEYACYPNPCDTDPCLPGVVWAVVRDHKIYHLTKDGEWIWGCEATSWNWHIPKEGDTVIVVGEASEETDIRGDPFINIEVKYLFSVACPVEEIYGEDSGPTELLRNFRDKVLHKTPEGQELIRLYYQWSPVIVKAIEEDEDFKKEVKEMIDGILMLIRGEMK